MWNMFLGTAQALNWHKNKGKLTSFVCFVQSWEKVPRMHWLLLQVAVLCWSHSAARSRKHPDVLWEGGGGWVWQSGDGCHHQVSEEQWPWEPSAMQPKQYLENMLQSDKAITCQQLTFSHNHCTVSVIVKHFQNSEQSTLGFIMQTASYWLCSVWFLFCIYCSFSNCYVKCIFWITCSALRSAGVI